VEVVDFFPHTIWIALVWRDYNGHETFAFSDFYDDAFYIFNEHPELAVYGYV
jgi:hypothetical protein